MSRRWLYLFIVLLIPILSNAQKGHVNDVGAVLYADYDPNTFVSDIFAVDPISQKTVNLTCGRVGRQGGWSGPWEPVGNQYQVVFRQGNPSAGYISRIFVLELRGNITEIYQIPNVLNFASWFTWSNDNRSFAFVNQHMDNPAANAEVVIVRDKQVETQIPIEFHSARAKWSPDGQWIAVISNYGEGLLLVSTEDYSVATIPLFAGVSNELAWGSDSRRIALVLDGKLSIIDLQGNVLQTFGDVYQGWNNLIEWSANGKYISYLPKNIRRQLSILFLGGSVEVDTGSDTDENAGVWSPNGELLAAWSSDIDYQRLSLWTVDADGKNPRLVKTLNTLSYMPPSWIILPRGMFEAEAR